MATTTSLIDMWRHLIIGDSPSWVLFQHGTCVIVREPGDDPAGQATDILREYGPVYGGSPAADFGTITLDDGAGWIVTSHHDDVLTYVGPDEIDEPNDLVVGLVGRSKRDQDGHELTVVHVEPRRAPQRPGHEASN